MKKKIILSIIIFLAFSCPILINASTKGYITGDYVRIRTGPGTNYGIVTSVNKSTDIDVLDESLFSGTGCNNGWYKISYNNNTGYVCSTYVAFYSEIFDGVNVIDWTARVKGNNVSIRKGPGTNYDIITTLTLGANINIIAEINGGSYACSSGKWSKVSYYNNSEIGYICSNYVIKKSDITDNNIDEEYRAYLSNEGFPESYFPYLNYLHKKHPTWIFKAGKTNLDFTQSVNGEFGKCYMQTTNDNYRISNIPAESNSWFVVNKGVVAFYLDPRNWMSEDRFFMFESLSYDESLEETYPQIVRNVFGSGALNNDMYVIPLVNAAKANLLNPAYVASRIRLEVGPNGSDSTNGTEFTWKGQTYSGYYNFFNIGAYAVTIDGITYNPIVRGLAYAAKLIDRTGEPWNNIETSIREGSSFLANAYVSKGQGTGYYQKFNVGPNRYFAPYTHQYMTNIQAPATEASTTYYSYSGAGTLGQTFVFEIPVFNNMPEYTSLPNSGDPVAYLSNLSIDNYTLTPAFDEDILTYEVFVPQNIANINISATPKSNKATVEGVGQKELQDDRSLFTITVISESGLQKKYNITVIKVENPNNPDENNITADQVIEKMQGQLKNNYMTNVNINTKVSDYKNDAIINGAISVQITDSNGVELENADILKTTSKISITTISETKTYSISVKGDTSGDGRITILDLLQVQKHLLNVKELANESFFSADTSGDGQITILDLLQIQKHLLGVKLL